MKLSTPDKIDPVEPGNGSELEGDGSVELSESSEKQGEGTGKLRDEMVSVLGDEMAPLEAIELMGEMLERPEAFGMVPSSRLTELNERVAGVEDENERLRRDLAVLWVSRSERGPNGEYVIPDGNGFGTAPVSLDVEDPVGEFDG